MQKIYDLIYQLARGFKSRFGYALTIKQAMLAAYFAFILAVFVELTGFIKTAYLGLTAAFPTVGGLAASVFPDAGIVSAGVTTYFGILIFKKATAYTMNMWGQWIKTTHL